MPNLAAVLKAEIQRLARKEARAHTQALQRASAAHRRQIAALRRQVQALERKAAGLARGASRAPAATPDEGTGAKLRFVPKGLVSLRKRLGLSAPELGTLLGVSAQSVYNWEQGRAVPRRAQLQALAGLRGAGKKDVRARLAGSGEAAPDPRAARPRKTRGAAPAGKRGRVVRRRAARGRTR